MSMIDGVQVVSSVHAFRHTKLSSLCEGKSAKEREFIQTAAVRSCSEEERLEARLSNRIIQARWVLTWKSIPEDEQNEALQKCENELKKSGKSSIAADGRRKAKARIVLIGYQHPNS